MKMRTARAIILRAISLWVALWGLLVLLTFWLFSQMAGRPELEALWSRQKWAFWLQASVLLFLATFGAVDLWQLRKRGMLTTLAFFGYFLSCIGPKIMRTGFAERVTTAMFVGSLVPAVLILLLWRERGRNARLPSEGESLAGGDVV
jgi:hypothetical protein